jgi:hypothetical protein
MPVMAKLTSKARGKLKPGVFAGPDRSYPIPDRGHAVAAKSDATKAVKAGRMGKGEEGKIDAKANNMLGKSEPEKHTQVKSDRGNFAFKENKSNRKK